MTKIGFATARHVLENKNLKGEIIGFYDEIYSSKNPITKDNLSNKNFTITCNFDVNFIHYDIVLCIFNIEFHQIILKHVSLLNYPDHFKIARPGEKYATSCKYIRELQFISGYINSVDKHSYVIDADVIETCSGGLVSNSRGIIGIVSSAYLPTEKYEQRRLHHKYYLNVQKTDILKYMFKDRKNAAIRIIKFTFLI